MRRHRVSVGDRLSLWPTQPMLTCDVNDRPFALQVERWSLIEPKVPLVTTEHPFAVIKLKFKQIGGMDRLSCQVVSQTADLLSEFQMFAAVIHAPRSVRAFILRPGGVGIPNPDARSGLKESDNRFYRTWQQKSEPKARRLSTAGCARSHIS